MSQDGTPPTPPPDAFRAQLGEYGAMTSAFLQDWLPTGEPYGYLYGLIRDYIGSSGKGFRPALMMASTKAFGGDPEQALTSAAALELLHNAFLIHDDIEDESDFRRGRACLHKRVGVPLAINAGDAMQALALGLLRRNTGDLGPLKSGQIVDEFEHLLLRSLEGQAMELGWIQDNAMDVRAEDYLRMSLKKTCWYSFIHPVRLGALIAHQGESAPDLDRFNAFGYYLGAAFQIQDDVLNLVGDEKTYGKEIGGDIYEGKRTLMLARLISLATPKESGHVAALMAKPRADRAPAEIDSVLEMMERYGCIDYARKASEDLLAAAQREYDPLFAEADPESKAFLESFMDYMITRQV